MPHNVHSIRKHCHTHSPVFHHRAPSLAAPNLVHFSRCTLREKACIRYAYVYVQVAMTFHTFLWHDVCTGIHTRSLRRLARGGCGEENSIKTKQRHVEIVFNKLSSGHCGETVPCSIYMAHVIIIGDPFDPVELPLTQS